MTNFNIHPLSSPTGNEPSLAPVPAAPRSLPGMAALPRRVAAHNANNSVAALRRSNDPLPVATSSPAKKSVVLKPAWSATRSNGRITTLSKRDLLLLVTQLSIMVRSGVDLAEAVRSIAQRSASEPIRNAMSKVYADLEDGSPLSQALANQSDIFGGVLVASVAAGEASGRLPEVLHRFSRMIGDELKLQSSIRSVVGYPIVLFLVTMLVLAAMIFFVLPQFAGIYASSRAPTPLVTRLLLDGAQLTRTYWWLVVGTGTIVSISAWRIIRSPAGRQRIDEQCFQLPLIKTICRSLLSGRMFRLQGSMLDSGVPMLDVLRLTRSAVGNACFVDLIDHVQESVMQGAGMAAALADSPCIPEGAVEMIATGEANGQLGSVLQTVGEFYETEGEQHLRDAVKIAEPAIIVGLGLVVGVIVLAVMLPLLDLSSAGNM